MNGPDHTNKRPGAVLAVAVFDDDAERIETLRMLLDNSPGFRCAGAWTACTQAVERVAACAPDVVLLDIRMPGIDGITGAATLRAAFPQLPILMQTVIEEEELIYQAIRAGADGYILKQARPAQLLQGIREVVEGGSPMSPAIARLVLKAFARMDRSPFPQRAGFDLTKREREILKELVEGLSQQMIADKLGIGRATVNTHVGHIYEKLQVRSVGAAVSKAIKNGLA